MVGGFVNVDRILTMAIFAIVAFVGAGTLVVGAIRGATPIGEFFGILAFVLILAGSLYLRIVATARYEKHPWFAATTMVLTSPVAIGVVFSFTFMSDSAAVFAGILTVIYLVTSTYALMCLIVHGFIWLIHPRTRSLH